MSKIDSAQMSLFTISTLTNFHPGFGFGSSFTPSLKAVSKVKKQLTQQLPEGRFGPTKYNNIGTFERIFL